MTAIELNDLEMSMADQIWAQRCARHKTHKYGARKADMDKQLRGRDGFAAELAVVQHLGITDHKPNFESNIAPDVGLFDVRQTQYEHGKLLLHCCDPDDRITILVTGRYRHFVLAGWIRNCNGKQYKYWGTLPRQPKRPAFIIPQMDLKPMYLLPKEG